MMNDFQITELAVKIAIALGLQYDPKNINLIETEIVDYLESQTMSKIAEIDFGINELENIKDYLDDNDIYFVNQRIAELEKKKSNFTV